MTDTFYYPSAGEEHYFSKLKDLMEKYPHDARHYLDLFTVYASRRAFIRQLAHYELFKLTVDLPGHYVDFGVYFGRSFFSWHKFIEVLTPTATHKKVFGFDTFSGFPDLSEDDGDADDSIDKRPGGLSSEMFKEEFFALLDLHNQDAVLPTERGMIIEGDVCETLPVWMKDNPEARFCLINLDMDLYDPTMTILTHCWDKLVPGGVLILDEYGTAKWPGETKAWDDFAEQRSLTEPLRRFPWANAPGAYLVKT